MNYLTKDDIIIIKDYNAIMESKRIFVELKGEYDMLNTMVIRSKENLKLLRENKEISIRNDNELEIIGMQLEFRNENSKTEEYKQKLLNRYNEHNIKKDLTKNEMMILRSRYKMFHETYVKTLKVQKQLIKQAEQRNKNNLQYTIFTLYNKHKVNEKLLSLTIKRNRAKDALDTHKELMAQEKRTRVVSKAKLGAPTEDICSICMENHLTKDTMLTGCKHQFGQQCYAQWALSCVNHVNPICCPLCKSIDPKIFTFREKAVPHKDANEKKIVRGKGAIGDAEYLLALSNARARAVDVSVEV